MRKTPGWPNVADESSWISVYECDWSLSGGKAPSFSDSWNMQQVCEEVSHTEPTEGQSWSGHFTRLPLATDPVTTMKIITISRLAFTEHGGDGDPDSQDHEYVRVNRR